MLATLLLAVALDVTSVWEFVEHLTGIHKPPPVIKIGAFDGSIPKHTLAWFYEGTYLIQISPEAIARDSRVVREPYEHTVLRGFVYMSLAHEMAHYAWDGRLPLAYHHCFFEHRGYPEATAQFLVDKGLAPQSLLLPRADLTLTSGCEAEPTRSSPPPP
jgi:hypothetical protein